MSLQKWSIDNPEEARHLSNGHLAAEMQAAIDHGVFSPLACAVFNEVQRRFLMNSSASDRLQQLRLTLQDALANADDSYTGWDAEVSASELLDIVAPEFPDRPERVKCRGCGSFDTQRVGIGARLIAIDDAVDYENWNCVDCGREWER